MKITSFNPMIVTPKPEALIEVFKALGFEVAHTKADIEGGENVDVRMRDADGHHVDITSSAMSERDMTSIRINVDDLDEAVSFFASHGFIDPRSGAITETGSSRSTFLVSPSGMGVTLIQHVRR